MFEQWVVLGAFIGRTGTSITEWLDRNSDLWPLVMPRSSVDKLCKEKYEWTAVASEVESVCESGPLGLKLFGFALKQVMAELLADLIEQEVLALVNEKEITDSSVVNCKQKCWQKIEAMKNLSTLPDRREVFVTYRGQKVKAKVACIGEEVELRIAAAVRGEAIKGERLLALSVETELLGQCRAEKWAQVKDSVIQESAAARTLCNQLISSTTDMDSEGILAISFCKLVLVLLSVLPWVLAS
jgi:hypothetical protein